MTIIEMENRTPTSRQLVKDGAARLVDMADDLEVLQFFEMETELGNRYGTALDGARHLVRHAEWCLREAARKIEQHYGGTVAYDDGGWGFVWKDEPAEALSTVD